MAVQSSFYPVDGKTLKYPQTKPIATKQHMACFVQLISDDTWVAVSTNDYDMIGNALVLSEPIGTTLYKQIDVRVADEQSELGDSASDIAVVASIATEITTVAGIADEVVTVANNDANVTLVGDDLALGLGTNEPTDSSILNALTNADIAIANAALTAADVVSTGGDVVSTGDDVVSTAASAAAALVSENNAAASAASIDPTNLLHTVGTGGSNPEGYTADEVDTNTISKNNEDQIKLGSLSIGESISITSWSFATTTITLTIASNNSKIGDTIFVTGLLSTTNPANGTYIVTDVTDTTIVYTALEPTGTPTVSSALVRYGSIEAKGEFIGKNTCTAWVRFNGTNTPPTIIDSFNVSDVVKLSAGKYEVYFSVPMDNALYSPVSDFNTVSTRMDGVFSEPINSDKCNVSVYYATATADTTKLFADSNKVSVYIFGGKD